MAFSRSRKNYHLLNVFGNFFFLDDIRFSPGFSSLLPSIAVKRFMFQLFRYYPRGNHCLISSWIAKEWSFCSVFTSQPTFREMQQTKLANFIFKKQKDLFQSSLQKSTYFDIPKKLEPLVKCGPGYICVAEPFRRRGVSKLLMSTLQKQLAERAAKPLVPMAKQIVEP